MFSISWVSHLYGVQCVVGDRNSVLSVYDVLLKNGFECIQVFTCSTGVKVNPETGLTPFE